VLFGECSRAPIFGNYLLDNDNVYLVDFLHNLSLAFLERINPASGGANLWRRSCAELLN
jgi:hypothetical protein